MTGKSHIAETLTLGQGGFFRVTLNGEIAFDRGKVERYTALAALKN